MKTLIRPIFRMPLLLLTLYAVVFSTVVLSTACPKKDALRKAIDASYRLPGTTNDLIKDVATGRDRGIIAPETARKYGELLNQMARAEVVYVQMVKTLKAASDAAGGQVNPSELDKVRIFFDASVVGPFLAILEMTKVLSGDQVKIISLAIGAVRLLLTTIGGGIGSRVIGLLAGAIGGTARLQSNNWSDLQYA